MASLLRLHPTYAPMRYSFLLRRTSFQCGALQASSISRLQYTSTATAPTPDSTTATGTAQSNTPSSQSQQQQQQHDQPEPILTLLRTDLKAAMKARDPTRTSVVRSLLNDVSAHEKSSASSPAISPAQFLSLLQKRIAAAQDASQQFIDAGRAELAETERAQEEVYGTYVSRVQESAGGVVETEEIRRSVQEVVEGLRAAGQMDTRIGEVMKRVIGEGGVLSGKIVDKSVVAAVVKEVTGQKK